MTRTAEQTTYLKSAATKSKLSHVSGGVYGRCTRISSSHLVKCYKPYFQCQSTTRKRKTLL